MKNLVLIICITTTLMGCSKDKNMGSTVVSAEVEFSLLNQDGEDLLNPSTPNYFPFENMKLFYLINELTVEVYDTNMLLPRNIALRNETVPYILGLGTYVGDEGFISESNGVKTGISVAYLQLSDEITDTIKTEWKHGPGYFINTKVWYNGELQEFPDTPFTVIK